MDTQSGTETRLHKVTQFEDVVDEFQDIRKELTHLLKFYFAPMEGDENYISWSDLDTLERIKELKSGDWASGDRFKELEESLRRLLTYCQELQKIKHGGRNIFDNLYQKELDDYIELLFVDYHGMDAFQIFLENYEHEDGKVVELTFKECWDGMCDEADFPWGTDDLLEYKEFRDAVESLFKYEINGWCGQYKYVRDFEWLSDEDFPNG